MVFNRLSQLQWNLFLPGNCIVILKNKFEINKVFRVCLKRVQTDIQEFEVLAKHSMVALGYAGHLM